MGSFFDSGPLPDWKDVQQWLGKEIPWKLAEKWDRRGDSGWLDQYVKNILQHGKDGARIHANANGKTGPSANARADVKRDAKTVTVTLRLAPSVQLRHLQLFVTSERLKITGLPDDEKKLVKFPCLVFPRSGRADMTGDGIVVIRFKRKPPEKLEHELFIRQ
ncbi:hypothetical protein ACFPPD_04235 [Cohnella suwonensis]|uniref:Uncharacterized protein n=1 Tax=Cohnella suwonensis TaxID=696072 RepID=A0ABW0LT97_9BACL